MVDDNKLMIKNYKLNYNLNNKKMIKCHQLVFKDKQKRPELYPEECIICGSDKNIDFHHPNYDFPLSVYPLCRSHHLQLHSNLNEVNIL